MPRNRQRLYQFYLSHSVEDSSRKSSNYLANEIQAYSSSLSVSFLVGNSIRVLYFPLICFARCRFNIYGRRLIMQCNTENEHANVHFGKTLSRETEQDATGFCVCTQLVKQIDRAHLITA